MNRKSDYISSLSLTKRQDLIRSHKLTIDQIFRTCYQKARNNSHLNAFISLVESRQSDEDIENDIPPLSGCILAVKDNIALAGEPLTCASKILEGYTSPYTATCLERIIKAGASVIGKTNLDEFAMGSSGEHSCFGATLNPIDTSRVPGGSSSGSAAAVASGMATAALGSDTGGSVRQPASFCGLFGLKPTYGRISRYGLTSFASSMDQIGLLSRNVDELSAILKHAAGCDPRDCTSARVPVSEYSDFLSGDIKGLRIGIINDSQDVELQPEIADSIGSVASELIKHGAVVSECELPNNRYSLAVYHVISSAEASSNLARYDGIRYGKREKAEPGQDQVIKSRTAGFGKEVKRRILLGTFVLSEGYYQAYYGKAQKVRRLIQQDFRELFTHYDLLLSPTTPTTAFELGAKISNPLSMYKSDIFTIPASLAGAPAISCPWGMDRTGLPVGIQFMADNFREDLLIRIASFIEAVNEAETD